MNNSRLAYCIRRCGSHWKVTENHSRESIYSADDFNTALNTTIGIAKTNLPSEVWIFSEHDELVEKRIYPNFSDIYV
ncbi:hypothetical protein [Fulvivirga sediminis]|uniref:Uncharacterized protein n=1 Tax=Fulvivirga sediminis TaxID=2803949 RepID=A0A937K187_9BACT|nr:hypothetical protein [Fulvivirga sediminis]MBL3658359.1 hypothetical protein [Fulvivirga sediminis]